MWVVRKNGEKRNEDVAMTNNGRPSSLGSMPKIIQKHLSEIQKGGTRLETMLKLAYASHKLRIKHATHPRVLLL